MTQIAPQRRTNLQSIVLASFFAILAVGCGTSTPSEDSIVKAYKKHVQKLVNDCHEHFKMAENGFTARDVKGRFKVEIAEDFKIDVKKSDSLVRPYKGNATLRRKVIWTHFEGGPKPLDSWSEVELESHYEEGEWKTTNETLHRLTFPRL